MLNKGLRSGPVQPRQVKLRLTFHGDLSYTNIIPTTLIFFMTRQTKNTQPELDPLDPAWTMPFGRYRNQSIDRIPKPYLIWAKNNWDPDEFGEALRAIQAELDRRGLGSRPAAVRKRRRRDTPEDHLHCTVAIRRKGPHYGLYCKPHNRWIKWLSQEHADILLQDQSIPFYDDTPTAGSLDDLITKKQFRKYSGK